MILGADSLKSQLCIYDLAAESTEVLLTHDGHIEAPNWHPEGHLIVNGGGRLYRVPLDAPALEEIDTGFAKECNNDHGIAPNGNWLAISDKSETEDSCIYIVPAAGGVPRKVTERTPSWWHGWSPDGMTLAYAAARDSRKVALYTIPAGGGEETCLCDEFDHIDGPDYAPDGSIWFNGEREGQVDLWRLRPGAKSPQRMTDGETVDWFPHPSPDGKHVVFLAYPKGTKGHPGGLDVALKLMPLAGGEPREIVSLHGGQGTINVPSWAPDSGRFAFMRYA